MNVLQLVTSPRPFFDHQVSVLEERGVDCTVCTVPGADDAGGRSPADYARFYPAVLSEIRSGEYDLIHANYGLTTPFAFAQPTRPVVVSLWGTDLMSDHSWLRWLSRRAARAADATVVPSQPMSEALETDHHVIPFGVDTGQFRPIPQAEARERVGWETDRPIALFPYDTERAVKDFPRARRLVERADADLELRPVCGVDYEEIPYYMNASDVLLVTSKRESGPMVVKEAAACNLPVVSTDVGFVRETIGDVAACVVSDDDDDLIAALERVAAVRGRSDGRDVIDGLRLEALGDRLHEVYRRVLERPDRSGQPAGVGHGT